MCDGGLGIGDAFDGLDCLFLDEFFLEGNFDCCFSDNVDAVCIAHKVSDNGFFHFFSFVKVCSEVEEDFFIFDFCSEKVGVADCKGSSVIFFVEFDNKAHIFDLTGVFVPHAAHLRKEKSPSFLMSVSGLPQLGQRTNSWA